MSRTPLLAAAVAGMLWLGACAPDHGGDSIHVLDRATLRIGDAGNDVDRRLPDRWSSQERAVAGHGSYRVLFDLDEKPLEPWAVYLPEVRMNVVVSANGVRFADGGSTEEPIARNWNRPLLFSIPTHLLTAGRNRLDIDLYASPTSEPRLSKVEVGPLRWLAPIHRRAVFRHITIRQVSVAFLLLIALGTAVVAALGAAPRSSLWLGAAALLVALGQLDGLVRDIPVSTQTWQVANTAAYLAGIVCFAVSVHRQVGYRAPRLEWGLAVGALALTGWIALSGPYSFVTVSTGILASGTALFVYALWRAYAAGTGTTRVGIVAMSIALVVIGAVEASGAFAGSTDRGSLASVAIPVVVAAFTGWLLLETLRQILDRNDALNEELDRRVAHGEAVLAESHQRIRTMERDEALASERERLVREMHDGLGGLLVSTLALVEGGEESPPVIADALREVLDEMRLMLDSLEPAEEDVLTVLGRLRARLAPRLERAGLSVDWQMPRHEKLPTLEPTALHHLLRIVQEAISNVIRHAAASRIAVRITSDERERSPGLLIEVCDDGVGLPDGAQASRRGLANMKRRAHEIGGEISIASGSQGTSVRLWLQSRASPRIPGAAIDSSTPHDTSV